MMTIINPARRRKHQQPMAEAAGFHRVVGNEHHGTPGEQACGRGLYPRTGKRIEGGERFIHQHNGAILIEGACQRRALAHPTGQRGRAFISAGGEPDQLKKLVYPRVIGLFTAQPGAEGDIFPAR